MMDDVECCWSDVLRPLLAAHRIRILDPADDHTPAVEDYLHDHYRRNIHPVLTPLGFDPGHPFPFISNLSMNLAVVVEHGRPHAVRPRQAPGRAGPLHPGPGFGSSARRAIRSRYSRTW